VKSNIGHAQAAAGVAGIIKMVQAMRHGLLPPTLHAGRPSPHVDWDTGNVRLLTEAAPWPAGDRPRRAGISSFGISGTNAHIILTEPPLHDAQTTTANVPAAVHGSAVWLLSARSGAALAGQARRLAAHLDTYPGLAPDDVGWSLATTRSALEHRAAITGASRDELLAGVAAVAAGEPAPGVVTGLVPAAGAGKTVFVFPGQGSQWAGMGRELAVASPVFAAKLAECAAALDPYVDWSLHEVLDGDLEAADVVQPALWAVMVSLAAVWEAAGVVPDAVLGHSQGEIAAACVAGILSLADGARVVALRSKALTALAGRGGMLSVTEPADRVRERLVPWGERLSVAAVNGPEAVVVSGEPAALDALAAECEANGIRAKRVPVDYASHSAQVTEIREQIQQALEPISPAPFGIPMMSAMTGQWLDGPEMRAEYWYESLRAPVEFDRAVRALAADGHHTFIEVSPHPVLAPAMSEVTVTGTLRRDDGGPVRMLACLAEAFTRGIPVGWAAVLPAGRRVDLPTYAFQHQRYWPPVPLLETTVQLAGGAGCLFTGRLSVRDHPWLADHAVGRTVLLPGTAFVELAIRAGAQVACDHIDELTLEAPLALAADGAIQLQVMLADPDDDGRRGIEIFARPDVGQAWTRHASGQLAPVGRRGRSRGHRRPVRQPGGDRLRVRPGVPRAAGGVATRPGDLRGGGAAGRGGWRRGRVRAAPGAAGRGLARGESRRGHRTPRPGAAAVFLDGGVAARGGRFGLAGTAARQCRRRAGTGRRRRSRRAGDISRVAGHPSGRPGSPRPGRPRGGRRRAE
jgi:acyl transferase domain-containing protein